MPAVAFGTPHKSVQRYDAHAEDYASLVNHLPSSTTAQSTNDVSSWFPNNESVVIRPPPKVSVRPLTYQRLQESLQEFTPYQLSSSNDNDTSVHVVALWLPPTLMAEMAVALITLLNQQGIAVAPVDSNMAMPKLLQSFQHLQCTGLVTTRELWQELQQPHNHNTSSSTSSLFQDVRLVTPDTIANTAGISTWKIIQQEPLQPAHFKTSMSEPPCLLLRTSGTTSTPKIVPLFKSALLYNATCLAASLQLSTNDVGCNAMPLFHIGGISCGLLAVLVSGSSVVMLPGPFDSHAFVDALTCAHDDHYTPPTYYYGVPSMHKANVLTAQARGHIHTQLRFIRSGAAHLSHELAVELAKTFQTNVIPTYSMTESMPIASAHETPITPNHHTVKDTVGCPIGPSVAILDSTGAPVPYGQSGEVCLKGPGVISEYIGANKADTHTPQGWLRTGDVGSMTRSGQLVLSGRLKEMIKRGGDQVWPNEVDSVIERLPEIQLAVSFGVSNELWGEEVQVAVVLQHPTKESEIIQSIQDIVEETLGRSARPTQIHFVDSSDHLPRGSTGKYKRTCMAEHLQATAVDNGALRVLEGMAASNNNTPSNVTTRTPSSALNGLRFLTVCFVVQHHVGLYPNNAWAKIQTFSLDMTIFFALAGFQLAAATKREVLSHAGTFIGTKIGSMQAFFMVAHGIAIVSSLLFQCGETGYLAVSYGRTCSDPSTMWHYLSWAILNMFTGMLYVRDVRSNAPSWFQAAFYAFLILFPMLDNHFRKCTNAYKTFVFVLNLWIASAAFSWLRAVPQWNFLLISWLPLLIASMMVGYFFSEKTFPVKATKPGELTLGSIKRRYGFVADSITFIFFVMEVVAATSPGCLIMTLNLFKRLRPEEEVSNAFFGGGVNYTNTCDVTYDEYLLAHSEPVEYNGGRLDSEFGHKVGFGRMATPLVLLWIFALAHGHGWTARLLNSSLLQTLGPFAYPVYLLHLPLSRFYWLITRGHEAQFWWPRAPVYPFPVAAWEMFFILGTALGLSWFLDVYVVRHILPYTISAYVKVYEKLASCCGWICCCCCCRPSMDEYDNSMEGDRTTLGKIQELVQNLTGDNQVTIETNLWNLGMDSLGASAMLAMLRLSIPAAQTLTLQQLVEAETVGDLVALLDTSDKMEEDSDTDLDSEFEKLIAEEEV